MEHRFLQAVTSTTQRSLDVRSMHFSSFCNTKGREFFDASTFSSRESNIVFLAKRR